MKGAFENYTFNRCMYALLTIDILFIVFDAETGHDFNFILIL